MLFPGYSYATYRKQVTRAQMVKMLYSGVPLISLALHHTGGTESVTTTLTYVLLSSLTVQHMGEPKSDQ
jgi:hypothetical protein